MFDRLSDEGRAMLDSEMVRVAADRGSLVGRPVLSLRVELQTSNLAPQPEASKTSLTTEQFDKQAVSDLLTAAYNHDSYTPPKGVDF